MSLCLFLLCFLPSLVLATGTESAAPVRVNWTDVVAVASIAANAILAVLLWLVNRKHEADQELKKRNQDQLNEATARVRESDLARQQMSTHIEHLHQDITALKNALGDVADDSVVTEIRGDFRSMKRDLDEARIALAGHQNSCADRFVHRSSYSEDQRAQRETVGLIHEMLKQQRDIIERIRP
jgi:septal ring factor EnvC (AmiA/AmiB activator)